MSAQRAALAREWSVAVTTMPWMSRAWEKVERRDGNSNATREIRPARMRAPFVVFVRMAAGYPRGTGKDNKISHAAPAVEAGDGQGAIADREADAFGRAQSHIAAGEHARQARLQRARLAVAQR